MDPENSLKSEIFDAVNQIDILQTQSINIFDKPQVSQRVFQLLDLLKMRIEAFTHHLEQLPPEENRSLQDLRFNFLKMKEAADALKIDAHEAKAQQDLIRAIDAIKEELNNL